MSEFEFLSGRPFFTTREFAIYLGMKIDAASRKLKIKAKNQDIIRVTRGVWGNKNHKDFSPYGAIPYLLNKEQGYLSFISALHRHGLISQIPTSIQVATTGQARVLKSQIGQFQFFKIKPELMQEGVEVFEGNLVYNMAIPEKALLDTFYLATKKGQRFNKLPEIDFDNFSEKKFLKLLRFYPKVAQKLICDRYLALKK